MNFETETEILELDLPELWAAAQQINEENDGKLTVELNIIEEGIDLKIPIYYINEEWYDIYPVGQSVNVYGYNKESIHRFMKEIETRKKKLRKIIYDNMPDKSMLEAR